MKKIASFFTALGIFLILITILHLSFSGNLQTNNKAFGTWNSPYKDLSYQAIGQNLHDNTILVFGSSEFAHGRKTPYHPKNLFKNENFTLMTVGGAYNQCLNHAITLGAVGEKVQDKKVVLLLSPQWFYHQGVSELHYDLRFSESSYIGFMQNKQIPETIKTYVAKRNQELLSTNTAMQQRTDIYDKIFVYHDATAFDQLYYQVRSAYVTDKDYFTIKSLITMANIQKLKEYNGKVSTPKPLNWEALTKKAIDQDSLTSHNLFYMKDSVWKTHMGANYKRTIGIHENENFESSPEYSDLKCFLDVCKAENIEPMLVLLPMNGKWYDHTGLPADTRMVLSKKIKAIGKQYGATVVDFSKDDYTPYMTEDAAHPWGVGWVKIDEEIYKFCN